MVCHLFVSFPTFTFTKPPRRAQFVLGLRENCSFSGKVRCIAAQTNANENIVRRSANYQPPIWDYDFVQSLTSEFKGEVYGKRINKLKEDVRVMLNQPINTLNQLELIDTLQRLGIGYHFEDEIERQLMGIYSKRTGVAGTEDIHAIALEFRLLRQHGYSISQDVFSNFQDEMGNFKTCLGENLEGMLSLYEASFLEEEGESILQVARDFTTGYLNGYIKRNKNDKYTSMLITHALEMPLHWRMPRLETRWFIDIYARKQGMDSLLLELAMLDFNYVQAIHQEDLKYSSRWWMNTGLAEKLSFARDRIMENFLWTIGMIFEPQFGYYRRMTAKLFALATTIDDIYDVYGTLDELELFTDAVKRWDVNAMEQLPDYMKICFLALHNSINEIAFDTLKEQGLNIIPYLKKSWADLCKAFLLEAKWYNDGYTPTLEEYIDNALISIAGPLLLVHGYFLLKNPVTIDALKVLKEYSNIIRSSAIIFRLADDLATSSDEIKRGDVPKSIQCYMHETGASEVRAREHIQYLISQTWRNMNKERVVDSPFSKPFVGLANNLTRMAQCMYQYGDGHGIEDQETKDRVLSLLIQPVVGMSHGL